MTTRKNLTLPTATPADWTAATIAAWSLALDAAVVIGLRSGKIAMGGDAARREAALMVSEKIATVVDLQSALLGGRLGTDPLAMTTAVLDVYTRKVRANRKRLIG